MLDSATTKSDIGLLSPPERVAGLAVARYFYRRRGMLAFRDAVEEKKNDSITRGEGKGGGTDVNGVYALDGRLFCGNY